ncbi:hypothetical protein HDU77_005962 [Chytriomyces hyalinus]|nr:hypothetical protein HDU77_005962 [Chytriomyces hyalinus]
MSNLTLEVLNQSSQAEPVFMFTHTQSMAFALVSGLTIEISCSGLISAACQFFEDPKLTYTLVITTIFNISSIVYSSITVWASLLGEENCIMGQMISTVCSQLFYVLFDIFMLMKAYAVSGLHPKVYYSCIAVGAYRVGWAIADIVESHGFWDAEVGSCAYYQNPITGIGYNSADIVVDAFSTIVALVFNWKHLKTSLTQIRRVLIQENCKQRFRQISMAFLAQNYIYTRCVNAESLFKSIRKNAIHQTNDSHKTSQVVNKSHASKAPSNNHLAE